MKTTQKILMAGLMYCCLASPELSAQPWYGHINYDHDSTFLSSAKRTVNNLGYVMAGFRPVRQVASTSPDFVIDKVDGAGAFGPGTFSNEYQIMAPGNCGGVPVPVHNCKGISIIETNAGAAAYAVAGAFDHGIFFAALDIMGNVISQTYWPTPVEFKQKPSIRESVQNPGEYYICASSGNVIPNYQGLIMKVNVAGAQLWGFNYNAPNVRIEPRDLIESPYNPADLIVVGITSMVSPNTGTDGFFMSLNSNTGTFNYFNYYNRAGWDSDDWFTSIEVAESPTGGQGYILGGRTIGHNGPSPFFPINYIYPHWMCKLGVNGNVIWTRLIAPQAHIYNIQVGEEINRAVERKNPNGTYEYYGVAQSRYYVAADGSIQPGDNVVVFKLDDNGLNSLVPNEFHYLDGKVPASPSATSPYTFADLRLSDMPAADAGIQAFATDLNGGNYFVKAYFNGISGCNESILSIDSLATGPTLVGSIGLGMNPINTCQGFILNPIQVNGLYSTPCYANSVPGGSNARMATSTGIGAIHQGNSEVSLYPNPVSQSATISVPGKAHVTVYNSLGQKVYEMTLMGAGELQIDFSALNLKSGFYSLRVDSGNETSNFKIVYKPE